MSYFQLLGAWPPDPDPHPGSAPGPRWGTSVRQTPSALPPNLWLLATPLRHPLVYAAFLRVSILRCLLQMYVTQGWRNPGFWKKVFWGFKSLLMGILGFNVQRRHGYGHADHCFEVTYRWYPSNEKSQRPVVLCNRNPEVAMPLDMPWASFCQSSSVILQGSQKLANFWHPMRPLVLGTRTTASIPSLSLSLTVASITY